MLHIIGLCGDGHTHFDLIDVFMVSGSLSSIILYVKMTISGFFKSKKKEIIK